VVRARRPVVAGSSVFHGDRRLWLYRGGRPGYRPIPSGAGGAGYRRHSGGGRVWRGGWAACQSGGLSRARPEPGPGHPGADLYRRVDIDDFQITCRRLYRSYGATAGGRPVSTAPGSQVTVVGFPIGATEFLWYVTLFFLVVVSIFTANLLR